MMRSSAAPRARDAKEAKRFEQEHTMSDRNPLDQSLKNSVEAVAERAGNRANAIKESVSDMARTATQAVDEGRQTAAERLGSAASAVRDRADQLPGGPKVQQFAHAAAEQLSTTADYMRSHDAKRMLADVERVVKNHPGPSLAIAAAFGFLIGRSLTRH
jgi:ElaB/YqjD/DUF883 family membrane-anchored ribosome-binding protein